MASYIHKFMVSPPKAPVKIIENKTMKETDWSNGDFGFLSKLVVVLCAGFSYPPDGWDRIQPITNARFPAVIAVYNLEGVRTTSGITRSLARPFDPW